VTVSTEKVIETATTAAEIHVNSHGGTFQIENLAPYHPESYAVTVTHSGLKNPILEQINLCDMPDRLVEEYVHCRVHAIAAALLGRVYPLTMTRE
jgi:hypothetical protein